MTGGLGGGGDVVSEEFPAADVVYLVAHLNQGVSVEWIHHPRFYTSHNTSGGRFPVVCGRRTEICVGLGSLDVGGGNTGQGVKIEGASSNGFSLGSTVW